MGDDAATDDDLPLAVVTPDAEVTVRRRPVWARALSRLPVLLAAFLAGGIIGLYFQPPGLQFFFNVTGLTPGAGTSTPIALPADVVLPEAVAETMLPTDVVGLARLMPTGDVSTVTTPYGAGDARVARFEAAIGQRVEAGALLAVLDNRTTLEAAVRRAEAEVALSEAALAQTRAAIQTSRDEARASLEQAQAAAAEAAGDLVRTEELANRGVTTQAVLDAARSRAEQTDRQVARAEATLARFEATGTDAQPDVIVAQRQLEAARIALQAAGADLARSEVRAPITGTVLDIHAQPGEAPGPDGLLDLGDLSRMMAEAEVWQDMVQRVAPGQPVEIVAEALGRTLSGEVVRVGLEVLRQNAVSDDTAANTDARVVKVLIALDDASSQAARRFTGLQVIARIDTAATGGAQ